MKTMTRIILSGFVLAALAAATPAFATGFNANFVISIGGDTYTFSLPDSPAATPYGTDAFYVTGVEVSENGGPQAPETVFFVSTTNGGDGGAASFSEPYPFFVVNPLPTDPALFIGSLSDPTFVGGVYNVQEDDPDTVDGTVTIYTPEPGTLALFGIGLLFLAGAVRRKLTA